MCHPVRTHEQHILNLNEPAVPQGFVIEGEENHLQDVADIPFEELVKRALVDVAYFPRHPGFLFNFPNNS